MTGDIIHHSTHAGALAHEIDRFLFDAAMGRPRLAGQRILFEALAELEATGRYERGDLERRLERDYDASIARDVAALLDQYDAGARF